jgi:antitoxin MazE
VLIRGFNLIKNANSHIIKCGGNMISLIKIGNSQSVRIPKSIVEHAKLDNKELEFRVLDEGLLIKPVRKPRQGWKEQFDKALHNVDMNESDQEWLGAPLLDDENWEW